MLTRTGRRIEATLVSRSKQTSRLWCTPSSRKSSQAALAAVPSSQESFVPNTEGSDVLRTTSSMRDFLKRRTPYTLIPTPLPDDRTTELQEMYFPSSPVGDLVAVMDACLHRLHDVPRAKELFDGLRHERPSHPILETRLYNAFIGAYIAMATTKDKDDYVLWMEEAWEIFDTMESGNVPCPPDSATYALMLIALIRFSPESVTPLPEAPNHTANTILSSILDRGLELIDVVSNRVFTSSSEASMAIQLLSKAAVELGKPQAVRDLGMATSLGNTDYDPLNSVPEVAPVLVPAKPRPGEEVTDDPPALVTPFNLEKLRQHLALVRLARRALPEDVAVRQKHLEESVWEVAQARMRQQHELFKQLGMDSALRLKSNMLQLWMWNWHLKLTKRLTQEIKTVLKIEGQRKRRVNAAPTALLGPLLALLKPETLSLITILEVMHMTGTGGISDGMKTARALVQIGKAVEAEYKAEMCRLNNIQIPATGNIDHDYFSRSGYRDLHARRVASRKYMEDSEEWTSVWTQGLRVQVGSILMDSLMKVATVERTAVNKRTGRTVKEDQQAFFHSYEYMRGQKLGVIRLNPVVVERLSQDGVRAAMHPRHLPMLVPPKPWLDYDRGGYLFNCTHAMRFKDNNEQLAYLKHASSLGHVELVYAGLDVLGSTKWKINREVFDVVLAVWNSGQRLGKIPPAVFDVPEPEKLTEEQERDIKLKSVFVQRQKAWVLAKANNHSDRCNVNYKVEIASAFLGDTLYLPHNIDFRGRAYPIPPHLNHIGDDLSRGLLKFGEKKPLGERGLRWLKVHLANLYGFDKANFDERVQFADDHMDDVYDSAEKPLEGKRWWTGADDPWQCLATCMELRAALDSPNPMEYESDIPVHQDGTCNGLQHYAALGGDDQGARQVNLSVTERPSDVYTYVASMAEKMIEVDVRNGDKTAIALQGKVSRKVVKQTVMTTVYGVTYVGAREQIEKQLRDKGDFAEEECWNVSAYVAKKVLACITDLFGGAKAIQTWLNLTARLIAKSIPEDRLPEAVRENQGINGTQSRALPPARLKKEQMTSVVWTTPLGLPVVQPYRKSKKKQVRTSLQTVYITDPNSPAEVNTMKQASAFPPNFIHSLDATHMMLTALECRTQGVTFASVHDSYWTHACSIDKMSEIIRDTFIALHSSDVLAKLDLEFKERYKGFTVPLASIRAPSFVKQLRLAGTRLTVTRAEADRLIGLDPLFISKEEEGEGVAGTDSGAAAGPVARRGRPRKATSAVGETSKKKLGRPSKADLTEDEDEDEEEDDADQAVGGKFVNLVDLLPPLPKKGDFNVKTIKKSQYFFS